VVVDLDATSVNIVDVFHRGILTFMPLVTSECSALIRPSQTRSTIS
jgi:hypothetical protein